MPPLRPHPVSLLHGGHRLLWCSRPSPVDQDQRAVTSFFSCGKATNDSSNGESRSGDDSDCFHLFIPKKTNQSSPFWIFQDWMLNFFIQKNNVHSTCGWSQRSFYKFCQDMNFAIWRSVLGTGGAKHSGWLMVDDPASRNSPSSLLFKKHLGSCLTTITARRGGGIVVLHCSFNMHDDITHSKKKENPFLSV